MTIEINIKVHIDNDIWRSLAAYSAWRHKESDRTERLNKNNNQVEAVH